ncbi:MAG: MFS transporter [Acidimicrobiia bacterium]|nr:MFS transporter [Acidimicrobiia bacterium]
MRKWSTLGVLCVAQFLMVLDTSVMNVAISQLIEDFDAEVTQIQTAITFYSLVMAALMLLGGKLGDVWGRRRAFGIGMAIYAAGSALTAAAWTVPVLTFGWSFLEGIGAALVLPAMAALVAGVYRGPDRAIAFGLLGGISAAGVAVGPILGGWVTTNLTWRVVFVGEVVVALAILAMIGLVKDAPLPGRKPTVDWLGAVISGLGLGLIVYGALQSSQWGFLSPRNSPVEPFGFALTPFVVGAGFVLLYAFVRWSRRREARGLDPLVRLDLFDNKPLRSGLTMTLAQNTILAGAFFALPLYLQLTLGFDAFDTGVRILPVSIALLITSVGGAGLMLRFPPRRVVRIGLAVLLVGIGILLSTIEPELDGFEFGFAMTLLGIGIGILAAVLGNLVQSAVGERDRSEAGGLQGAATQLGTALGTAVIGAIVISGLASSFTSEVASDERISPEISGEVEVSLSSGVSFVTSDDVRAIIEASDAETEVIEALVESYEDSQLEALRAALFATAVIVVITLFLSGRLPTRRVDEIAADAEVTSASADDPPV